MKVLTLELQTPFVDPDVKSTGIKRIICFLNDHKRANNIYALRFFFCEMLNFINVVGQIYLTNKFLGNDFLTYGSEVIGNSDLDPEKRTDALSHVSYLLKMTLSLFPKRHNKLNFYRFSLL